MCIPYFSLPWWFLYVSWCLVIMICLVSSYFVMLYGLKYGYDKSVEWLVSFLTGFTQSAFVVQPMKVRVLIYCMVFNAIFKSISVKSQQPSFRRVLIANTTHNILSKPQAAFPHNHCRNNGQR